MTKEEVAHVVRVRDDNYEIAMELAEKLRAATARIAELEQQLSRARETPPKPETSCKG